MSFCKNFYLYIYMILIIYKLSQINSVLQFHICPVTALASGMVGQIFLNTKRHHTKSAINPFYSLSLSLSLSLSSWTDKLTGAAKEKVLKS